MTRTPLVLAMLLLLPGMGLAQAPVVWGDLTPGAHGVGYDMIAVVDSSRVVRRSSDDARLGAARSPFRTFAIHLWYPADVEPSQRPLTYRDYALHQRTGDFSPDSARQRLALNEDWNNVQRIYERMTRSDWERWLDVPFLARHRGRWAPGRHPLIIGHLRAVSTQIAAEYLASHGFVVAMVRPPGRTFTRAEQALVVEDQERALAHLRRLPGIAAGPVGAMGFSGAGFTPLLLTMKRSDVAAFASIESGYFAPGLFETLTSSPFYDASRLTVPFLYLYSDVLAADDRHFDEFGRLRYAERYHFLLRNPDHDHWDYATEGMAVATLAPARHPAPALARRGFKAAHEHLLAFFRSTLMRDSSAAGWLARSAGATDSVYKMRIFPAAPAPLDADVLVDAFRRTPQRARAYLDSLADRDSSAVVLRADNLNRLGYELLRQQSVPAAISVFEVATRRYPTSANAFDSFAEALEVARDTAAALAASRTALSLASRDSTIDAAARMDLERLNRERIVRLGGTVPRLDAQPTSSVPARSAALGRLQPLVGRWTMAL